MKEMLDVLNELGEYTGQVVSRKECHRIGLWHRAVYAFVFNKNGEVLLQKRSKQKKTFPEKWDVTVGGHVDSGEYGRQSLIREVKEELGIDVDDDEIKYLFCSTSKSNDGEIINNHYNEGYLILKDIDVSKIVLEEEEVEEVRFFTKAEILERINNNYDGLTYKTGVWNFLKRYYENSIY